jgi:Domain of unknown function (DUF5666)
MNTRIFRTAVGLVLGSALVAALLFAQDAQQSPSSTQQEGQSGPPGAPARFGGPRGGAFGTVQSVGVNQLVIKRRDGSTTTVQVNSETKFWDRNKPIELEDLKPGDRVMVRAHTSPTESSGVSAPGEAAPNPGAAPGATAAPAVILAASVMCVPAGMGGGFNAPRAFGRITAINGNQLTVQNRQGEQLIVVASDAQILKDGQAATLKDFKVGDRVMALGQETNGQFTASRIMSGQIRRGSEGFGGQGPGGPPPQNP